MGVFLPIALFYIEYTSAGVLIIACSCDPMNCYPISDCAPFPSTKSSDSRGSYNGLHSSEIELTSDVIDTPDECYTNHTNASNSYGTYGFPSSGDPAFHLYVGDDNLEVSMNINV